MLVEAISILEQIILFVGLLIAAVVLLYILVVIICSIVGEIMERSCHDVKKCNKKNSQ